uniref:Uncharacterized protein n=1 Tax=Magnetococcus massalia (strain MO-1) TaxID=451514 RepID=A0A1S7LK03_MAGMO|nr:Protein of unknown function [Candidatus Magnetococcus massalia]
MSCTELGEIKLGRNYFDDGFEKYDVAEVLAVLLSLLVLVPVMVLLFPFLFLYVRMKNLIVGGRK